MVTIENAVSTIVSTPGNASLLLVPGVWHFDQVTTVRGGTNAVVNTGSVRDGGVIVVDSSGWLDIYEGPRLDEASIKGFAIALLTVGMVLFVRWVLRRFGRAVNGGVE